eukprot:scpid61910/ scgid2218/ Choline dehydrogenase, mitochondrial
MKGLLLISGIAVLIVAYFLATSPSYNDVSLSELRESYDYVIVGAGSAGCVLAARLTENPNVSVLLLESGGDDDLVSVRIPLAASTLPSSRLNWNYKADTDPGDLAGRWKYGGQFNWIAGHGIGGGSSVNWMMYTRGHADDFNAWEKSGAKGWSYADVLPYFKKAESYIGSQPVDEEYHGDDGPLAVTTADPITPALAAILDAAEEAGYGRTRDYNGQNQFGFGRTQYTIKNGRRWSAADAYLRPAWHRPNLHVMTGAHVSRVLMRQKIAGGVEFFPTVSTSAIQVRVRKEVLVSAGAVGTPKILMLSGIGPREELTKHGIPVVEELNVGKNLQDHVISGLSVLLNGHHGGRRADAESLSSLLNYYARGRGLLATSALDVTGFVRTSYAIAENWTRPDVQFYVNCMGIDPDLDTRMGNMDKGIVELAVRSAGMRAEDINACSVYMSLLHPDSVGHMRLRSTGPFDSPLIRPMYFSQRRDVQVLAESLRMLLQLLKMNALSPYVNGSSTLAVFDALRTNVCPGLALDSDECLERYVQAYTSTSYHYCSTCKMGAADDSTAVVDEALRVRGVAGLRVVDASVMPSETSGNLNAPTIMIAEKAADMIKERWGLELPE